MLSTPSRADEAGLKCHIKIEEMLYPAFEPAPGANRFNWTTGVPPLLQITIPHLTQQPDDLYAALEEITPKQPPRLLSAHLRWLFGVLAGDKPAQVVVERSGGSLAHAAELLGLFPQARVVHLFRDGRECAVSMSQHPRFKIAAIRAAMRARLGYDPYQGAGAPSRDSGRAASLGSRNDEALEALTPDRVTGARFEQFDVPLRRYGVMWSKMIADGMAALPDKSRLLTLDYADLVTHPREAIGRLTEFLEVETTPGWENRMAAQIRPGRDVRREVGEQEWAELSRACRLGMNCLYGHGNWT
jgi:putative sulfotransferase